MKQKKCLAFYEDKIEILDLNPCLDFLINVLEKDVIMISKCALKYNLDDLQEVINKLLSERECMVIEYLYGVGCVKKTQIEVADILDVSCVRVRTIRDKALRKMSHSSQIQYLTGIPCNLDYQMLRRSTWRRNVIKTLKSEIECICNCRKETHRYLYLPCLMKKYDFSLENNKFLSEKGSSSYSIIDFIHGNEKIEYKYSESKYRLDTSETASFIWGDIINHLNPNQKAGDLIYDTNMTPGLQNLLLMMGYLFTEDVYADATKIARELEYIGFANFSDELLFIKEQKEKNNTNERLVVCSLQPEIVRVIEENHCISTIDFIEVFEKNINGDFDSLIHCLKDFMSSYRSSDPPKRF